MKKKHQKKLILQSIDFLLLYIFNLKKKIFSSQAEVEKFWATFSRANEYDKSVLKAYSRLGIQPHLRARAWGAILGIQPAPPQLGYQYLEAVTRTFIGFLNKTNHKKSNKSYF